MPIRKAYFFADKHYWRYDIAERHVESGWPKRILSEWRRWPNYFSSHPKKATDALNAGNGKAYFFFKESYFRFDMALDRMDVGPLTVHDHWGGVAADTPIDAAVRLPGGVVCLFQGRMCTRLDFERNQPLPGYPRRIADDWPGMPDASVGAALNIDDGAIYFFKGNLCARFELGALPAIGPFENVSARWPGLPDIEIDAALEWSASDLQATCVPVFDPSFWNDDQTIRINNNCYNYGCNRSLSRFSDPGVGASKPASQPFTIEGLDAGVRSDGLVPVNPDDPDLSGCAHLIMMFLDPVRDDFHFYHRNVDRTWSHKPSHGFAKNVDESGNRIIDPRTANTKPYIVYCGTYRVDRSHVNLG